MINYTTTILETITGQNDEIVVIRFSVIGEDDVSSLIAEEQTRVSFDNPTLDINSTIEEQILVCESSQEYATAKKMVRARILSSTTIGYDPSINPVPGVVITDEIQKKLWATNIDNTVARIIARFDRFQMGYTQRENAAVIYKEAGYTGDPTIWISRFADNNGMTYQAAADLILLQASTIRNALESLESLRMDKYKVLNASDMTIAEHEYYVILAECERINASLT